MDATQPPAEDDIERPEDTSGRRQRHAERIKIARLGAEREQQQYADDGQPDPKEVDGLTRVHQRQVPTSRPAD